MNPSQGGRGNWPFVITKKLPLSHSPELFWVLIVFGHLHILGGSRTLHFNRSIQNKHDVVWVSNSILRAKTYL